ncbi:MAG: ORF6N domain-containing protein [Thermoplasmata archaeon]|nr:ORF6N domain-containing protein [Thermoplasmata archaeon]
MTETIDSELTFKEDIRNRIHTIRGVQVMLDRDLAELYEVKPIRLREQVKRNIARFPSDFMFRLTDEEVNAMVSQNAIPSRQHLGGSYPYVFTEQGVAAISSVLTSDRAVEVSIQIMRAFVAMRRFIASNALIFQRLDTLEFKQIETDKKMEQVLNAIESKEIVPKQGIFFDGQVFDAYIFISDLFRSAEKSIVIIDNYLDDSVLIHLTKRKKNVKVTLLTRTISKSLAQDVRMFNEQYPPIEIKEFRNSHDRFIIIDNKTVYHFGASLKDLGKKWFAFSKMDIGAGKMLAKLNLSASEP